jgi:hypothetical protein
MIPDDRLEKLLALGHPEVDEYEPPRLDVSRSPSQQGRRIHALPALAATLAVVTLAVIAASGGATRPEPRRAVASDPIAASVFPEASATPTTTPSVTLARPAPPEIVVVDRPSSVANDKVVSEGLFECVLRTVIDAPRDDDEALDARIEASGIREGWLTPGVEWVGTRRPDVAAAFGAYWAAMPTKPGPPLELLSEVDGRIVWKTISRVRTHDHIVWREGGWLIDTPCGARTPVEITRGPEMRMMGLMSATGAQCFATSDPFRIPLDPAQLDVRIDAAGIEGGWLSVLHLWVGAEASDLTRALAASWAGMDGTSPDIWILTDQAGGTYGQRWVPIATPAGRTVWQSWDLTSVTSCRSSG